MKAKTILTIILFIFSYFYTYQCINFLKKNDTLMQEIIKNQSFYNQNPINATITQNTIIPGIKGRKINLNKSYKKMKKINKFDESLLIYDYINPKISIKDTYNKIIINGNNNINNVSLILNINNQELFNLLNYILIDNNVKANILTYSKFNINNTNYTNIISYNYSSKIDYCITNSLTINKNCIQNNKYTILGKNITNYYLKNTKELIKNGAIIIYTFNKNNYYELNIILKYLKNNNYNIVSIDELIHE